MKQTMYSVVLVALLALVSLVGVTTGLTIHRDLSPPSNALNVSFGGVINPIGTPVNGLPSSGSSLSRRSYRKSAPYGDPHSIDPIIFVGADDLCKDHKTLEDGDWYCQKVDQVIYTNVGSSGEYREVALIFRGPVHLQQLAVYYPSASGASRQHYYNAASQTSQGLTFHLDPPAGDANWLQRPIDQNAPIKVAVWFDPADGGTASVKALGRSDGVEFGGQLNAGEVGELKKRSEGVVSETNYAVRRGQA